MKFLNNVRLKANRCRQKVGISSEKLIDRIEKYIADTYSIELSPCHKDILEGGKAEIVPEEGCLYYDEDLNSDLNEKIFVITHELGHLKNHSRLTKQSCRPDPIYNDIYGLAGKDSLARYNPRSLEEVEANAFAAEFLCPAQEAFQLWLTNPEITLNEIAEHFGSPLFLVRSQLAGALHEFAFEDSTKSEPTQLSEYFNNPKQDEAARWLGSSALVDAGPGTGKTATLIKRIEFLLTEFPDDTSNILVLTFSNEACNELYDRVASKFDDSIASQIEISTFHGFGLSLIQKHGHRNNLDLNTCVLDEAGQRELLNESLGDLHNLKVLEVSKPDKTVKESFRHISFLKERMITPELFEEVITKIPSEETAKKENAQDLLNIFKAYENLKNSRNKLDFADLILKSVDIFDKNSDVVKINRKKYKWVLVDEYQDVSRATSILLQRLCGKENPPWVVGDKRQSIFRFCGANPENIDKFDDDFSYEESSKAKKFTLDINYRSAEPLVKNKNKLANLMENEADADREIWKTSPKNPKSEINPPITFAIAESDEAERNGIIKQVQSWIKQNVNIKDIAVLARRNEDVRNIVLALTKEEIPAVASGIVTAEGNAGDLANVITFGDNPIPSVSRLVYCLGKHNHSKKDLDNLIAQLVESFRENKEFSSDDEKTGKLFQQVSKIYKSFSDEKFSSDAFSIICVFLFESSDYLRNILNLSNEIEKSLALNEVVTTLTQTATYRFSHQDDKAHISRKNFAKYFRESLSQSNTPTTTPPSQLNADAVKVMTCHASKGLEFPYVIVAGQTLSGLIGKKGEYKWLPPALAPKIDDDIEQANSTLFVGMSRAKQGLTVSYSKTSTGLPTARQRKVVPLLESWSNNDDISNEEWNSFEVTVKESFKTNKIWGGNIKYPIASRKLDKGECALSIYLQDGLGLKFPLAEKSFYPSFYVALRMVLRSIVIKIFEKKRVLNFKEALTILEAYWNFEDFHIDKNHTHHNLYWNLAKKYVKGFIDSFIPENVNVNFIKLIVESNEQEVELDLLCAYRSDSGSTKAIFFRPESLKGKLNKQDKIVWSKINDKYRVAFVLLKKEFPNLEINIFSGEDGKFYNFNWARDPQSVENAIVENQIRLKQLSEENFVGTVVNDTCNYRCENRINCPHWIGALN